MSGDLVPVEGAQAPSIFERSPDKMVEYAAGVANTLKNVIDKQNLSVKLGAGTHVKAEGWSTLGTMLGVVPREVSVDQHDDGTYEAVVELYNIQTDRVVGRGSAICSPDEKNWRNRDRFARRSMAITRATSKAYRLSLGWIVTLAGYEVCPAEEMDTDPPKAALIFDMGDEQHCVKLTEEMKKRGVSAQDRERLIPAMHGKEFSAATLGDLIREMGLKTKNPKPTTTTG